MDIERLFPIGYEGQWILRDGDKVYYSYDCDSDLTSFRPVIAKFLGKKGIERALNPEGVESHDGEQVVVELGRNYAFKRGKVLPKGTLVRASLDEIYWDERKPIPAARVREFIEEREQSMPSMEPDPWNVGGGHGPISGHGDASMPKGF